MAYWEEKFADVFGLKLRPWTMMERYNRRKAVEEDEEEEQEDVEEVAAAYEEAPRTSMDRWRNKGERSEKNKEEAEKEADDGPENPRTSFGSRPRTMMERLADRDKAREKLAKEEQAKVDPTVGDYNTTMDTSPAPTPAQGVESHTETVSEDPGSSEFQDVVEGKDVNKHETELNAHDIAANTAWIATQP